MTDLISRADAIEAVHGACNYCDTCDLKDIGCSQINALSALPSADAVSMEEHVKELNDLASAWKNKFVNAEKRTEELYDETMRKVANECKTCKERLQNLRPSADAVQGEWKRTEINGYQYAVCDQCHLLADMVEKDGKLVMSMANADDEYANFCPNCGARMKGGEQNDD